MTESEKLDLILSKLGKLDKLEAQFGGFNERLERLETEFGECNERLERLETEFGEFKERLDRLEADFGGFKERLDRLETEFGEFRGRLDRLDSDVTGIKLILENEIRPNIMRVAEGHLDLYRKLREATRIDDEKEMIAIRVNIMEEQLRTIKERLDQIA